ncbi:MAG: hypothetical protein PF569_02510 [Candidatus Woesearchaeota archaeon]|jgi:hypothetical protein|nr:hypothetical protein [Candidatus Woesearchaeota archaeon]
MIVFFTEDDLVSFGTFLLSEERKDVYKENFKDKSLEEVKESLKTVNNIDLEIWASTNEEKQ